MTPASTQLAWTRPAMTNPEGKPRSGGADALASEAGFC
jgi:hypothetical protein